MYSNVHICMRRPPPLVAPTAGYSMYLYRICSERRDGENAPADHETRGCPGQPSDPRHGACYICTLSNMFTDINVHDYCV